MLYVTTLMCDIVYLEGERSQVVKAPGCDSGIRGFDSRRSPCIKLFRFKEYIKVLCYCNSFRLNFA